MTVRKLFTFQSGHILIEISFSSEEPYSLYIPIWTYSNKDGCRDILKHRDFTFQSGHILIDTLRRRYALIVHLYIPIWTYSNEVNCFYKTSIFILYIPIWTYSNYLLDCLRYLSQSPLHSNLDIF